MRCDLLQTEPGLETKIHILKGAGNKMANRNIVAYYLQAPKRRAMTYLKLMYRTKDVF